MFYSQVILARKEPLGKIWLAAHFDKKLTKTQIFATDICSTVENVLNPSWPLALRVSGQLMLGIVRIYSRKVKYLMTDCTEAMWKIKLAFKPGNIDLELDANQASTNNVDDTRYFGHINPEFDFPELADAAFSQGLLNKYAILKAARGRTIANQRETIEEDYFSSQKIGREVRDSHASKLQGRNDQNEWSPSQGRVSDIEVFRGEHSISEPRLMRSSISSMGSGMAATFDVDTIPAFEEYPLRPMESDQIYDNFVPYDMQVDNYVPPIAEDLVENRLSEIMTENFLPIEESPQKQRRSHDPDTSLASLKEQKTAINKRKKQKVLVRFKVLYHRYCMMT
jgi:cohesin complex subunit SCC1